MIKYSKEKSIKNNYTWYCQEEKKVYREIRACLYTLTATLSSETPMSTKIPSMPWKD